MSTPAVQVNGNQVMAASSAEDEPKEVFYDAPSERPPPTRKDTTYSKYSTMSVPPVGSLLTGKQEHCESAVPLLRGLEACKRHWN